MIRFNVWFLLDLFGCWMELALVSSGWFVGCCCCSGIRSTLRVFLQLARSALITTSTPSRQSSAAWWWTRGSPSPTSPRTVAARNWRRASAGQRAPSCSRDITDNSNDTNSCLLVCFRINVGGKLLTNHLKEIISYRFAFSGSDELKTNSSCFHIIFYVSRQLHVMDETYVINQVKEDVCYVSQHFYKDMESAQ